MSRWTWQGRGPEPRPSFERSTGAFDFSWLLIANSRLINVGSAQTLDRLATILVWPGFRRSSATGFGLVLVDSFIGLQVLLIIDLMCDFVILNAFGCSYFFGFANVNYLVSVYWTSVY